MMINNLPTNRNLVGDIYERYAAELKLYFTSYTHDVMAAEDMMQDLFVKLMGLDLIHPHTAKSLIFVIARRMIIDDARHKAFVRIQEKNLRQSMDEFDSYSVVRQVENEELVAFEQKRLSTMAPKRAQVYKMWREDMTNQEIAEELNIGRRTVETHLYLSTREMRQYLRKIV